MLKRNPIINGRESTSEAGIWEVHNPFNDEVVGTVGYASASQMSAAIAAASDTFRVKKLTASERITILLKASKLLAERKEIVARTITLESGKPITYSRIEVDRAIFTLGACAEAAKTWDDDVPVDTMNAPNASGKRITFRNFAAGPVAAITPFNFPLNLVVHKVAPAIACGCPVILKPAPQTPLTSYLLADILHEAGLPGGWLNVIPCDNDVAESMVTDERIKVLSFTGSAAVGWKLKSLVPKKKVTLELGGNGAVIVDEVKDWDKLISSLCTAAFYYAGQVCISLQRLFVTRNLCDELLSKFTAAASRVVVGDPMKDDVVVGPMISNAAAEKAWGWIEASIKAGAKKHLGEFKAPNWITPTILTDVPADTTISCEEAFAPVVLVEPYDNFSDAIARVNSSRYGLQVGVFTSDNNKIEQAYKELEAGGVIINETNTFRTDAMPYGGVKDSGFGREGVRYAMAEMCEVKVMVRG